MVVLSPPGRISPLRPSSSPGSRTCATSAPSFSSIAWCSAKSPCSASTPTFILAPRPASPRDQLARRDGRDLPSHHRLAQVLTHLRQNARVLVVRGGLDDRRGSARRVAGLEDPRAD